VTIGAKLAALSDDEFREGVHEFLVSQGLPPAPRDRTDRLSWQKEWSRLLADNGLAGPTWPRGYGGMELAFSKQVILAEELARARVPGPPGTGVLIAGPTLIAHGTQEQKERWLRPLLRGDIVWAQAFSEPDAGSDLLALRTRAVRDGERYVVAGTKVWSSWAEHADAFFALVKTDPVADPRDGISYLIIDARARGVTVRPIVDMSGISEFCEIIFDDVEVPVTDRIGAEHGGWSIARTSLGHERAAGALNQARFYRRVLGDLMALVSDLGRQSEPSLRQQLAQLDIEVRIMHYSGERTIAEIGRSGEPGARSSASRLFNSQVEQRLHEVAVDVMGAWGLLSRTDPASPGRGRWVWGFLRTRASTIGAGTAEIHRNTLSERVLGLPREPGERVTWG
jgi:alkylation response protein AidB-like acyl-CoA dehydrogenase